MIAHENFSKNMGFFFYVFEEHCSFLYKSTVVSKLLAPNDILTFNKALCLRVSDRGLSIKHTR